MNNCLQILQKNVIPYLTSYKTPHITFPYNICVTGPQYSGKTTICSILSQALDVTIIQVLGASTEKKKSKTETQEPEVLLEEKYPLPNMKVLQYIDDKQIISEIISSMNEQHKNYGYIFSGFPVTKAQFSALEKAISSLDSDSIPKSPRSPRKKAKESKQPISGIIFSMHTPEKFMERYVDPITGHVFSQDFNSPSFMELEGIPPIDFGKRLEEVISRLVNYNIPEEYEQNQKTISQFAALESSLKKSTSTLIIRTKKHFREIIEQIDDFISPYTTMRPCSHLVSPQELLLAAHSYLALQSWQQILFTPGRTIADQSKLVNSLSSKLDELTSNAIDRFSLVISQQDHRSKLVEDFKNKEIPPKETYTKIWEESILVRDENLSSVDGAIEFAGMIELVLEMKKAPKIVFMALASKLLYGMWFRTEFKNVIDGKEELLSPLNLLAKEIEPPAAPIFDFQEGKYKLIRRSTTGFGSDTTLPTIHTTSAAFPASQTIFGDSNKSKMQRSKVNIEERRALAELKGFDYLTEVMPSLDIKSSQNIKFDLKRFCQCMGIPMLKMTTNFNSTLQYAEEFFTKLRESALSDESLSNECTTMLSSF
ncbi:hypothetical protein TVAGG3_0010670 [Trichomonas vaginalis G3]|nr:hypothetical protein TVAGG3_0010670 [Trichomonas vaginalis G3]KAI5539119.1 hypothetical protein TVAGG3_0010670 [Trichomonas vaginalis G3]